MRKPLLALALLTTAAGAAQAQTGVGIGTSTPDASAALDISSTTKGLLPPRMTASQRGNLSSPATGLVIFNTDNNQLEVNTGTPVAPVWTAVGASSGLYSTDGTLSGARTVNQNGNNLSFTGGGFLIKTSGRTILGGTNTGYAGLASDTLAVNGTARLIAPSNNVGTKLVLENLGIATTAFSLKGDTTAFGMDAPNGSYEFRNTIPDVNGIANGKGNLLMKIAGNGNVGIGTLPTAKLDVDGTTRTTGLQVTGSTPAAGKVLTSDATGNATWQNLPAAPATLYTADGTLSSARTVSQGVNDVTFSGTGNLVKTSGRISVEGSLARSIIIKDPSNTGVLPAEVFFDKTALNSTNQGSIGVGDPTRGMFLWYNGTDRVNIDPAGNVGIGAAAPTAKLDVAGTTRTTGLQVTGSTPAAGKVLTSDATGNATWQTLPAAPATLYTADGTLTGNRAVNQGTNSLTFSGTGGVNLNSGTVQVGDASGTTLEKLVVNGRARLKAPSASPADQGAALVLESTGNSTGVLSQKGSVTTLGTDQSTGSFEIRNGMTDASTTANGTGNLLMRVDGATSNVGIGTAAPAAKLDVAGTFKLGVEGSTLGYVKRGTITTAAPITVAAGSENKVVSTVAFDYNAIISTNPKFKLPTGLVITQTGVGPGNVIEIWFYNSTGAAVTIPTGSIFQFSAIL